MGRSPARFGVAVGAFLAATTALGMTAVPTAKAPASDESAPAGAVLLYTGEQRGYLEPCGCTKPQIGGLPRRASLLASLAKGPEKSGSAPEAQGGGETPRTLVVDNGDMVEDPGRQSQLKAEALASFYHANRYDAINLG